MSRDLYASLSGATSAWRQLETVSNNLANADTVGFRAARVSFALTGPANGDPEGAVYASVGGVTYTKDDGALAQDDVPTHVALRGDGFFSLEDGTATRAGAFRLDAQGKLVTPDGVAVMGEGGPIQVDPKEPFTIGSDGTVRSTSGDVGKLAIVTLSNPTPLGGTRWSGSPTPVTTPTVVQGALEGSNADPMTGMAELIEASRFFEAQQKVIQTSDEMQARLNRAGGRS